jgi:hypothetical protein
LPIREAANSRHNRYRRAGNEVDSAACPIRKMPCLRARNACAMANRHAGREKVHPVEINRNQYFLMGLVVLLLGLQVRAVESYVLNERASHFVAEKLSGLAADGATDTAFMPAAGPTPLRTVRPPIWLGYAFLSLGAVLILHSLAMKRPGG